MTASSISSPATRIDLLVTIPPSAITATSVVPPPMSTTMLPTGSATRAPPPTPDAPRLPPDHPLGRLPPGEHLAVLETLGHDLRLTQDDAYPSHVDQRVVGA